ncbi:MAG: winged helix-turn-helix transcriptional regulator [Nitrososphaerota archaeon]|nr:winged helix-turn-helix transcriptional regulator [Nitrososphaerota archaeon]MDG6990483.1 winged helix-turn-helix transcriptional regulator [Nitrososphaerota archaeon]
MNTVFAALSNPERRMMLDMLREGGRPAGDLVAAFPDLPQPAVSRHLRILREAGLVTVVPRAQQRVYSLAPAGLHGVEAWVSTYRDFWSGKLGSLSEHLGKPRSRRQN